MNIGLLSILHNKIWDFRQDMAQAYATALKNAIELQLDNDIEKQHGYFLSKKGYKDKDGKTVGANFEDKLYVGNIHRIENHLYWEDEELADDDQIINVVVVDGPITRDGGGCSYGSKDWRDQVMYANTIPQVIGHLFVVNTPGGESAARNDYEMMINDCREKDKPTVTLVDGGCYSSGVNLACRTDYVIVMNPKDGFGCIGSMAAFWAVAHDTVDQDGYRYVELVGKDCPEKNDWYREAAKGEYEKLQAELDKDTEEFHQTVRENRPLVTDEMLSGKVFEAQEVIPALVDEIGDMERAIECVFALANKEMQAARFMTAEPSGEPDGNAQPEEPEELAKLNAQQKAAINKEKDNLTVVDDGHVSAERQGFFGPTMEEIATPNNNKEMTEQEKKAAEAEAAQAAEQEAAEQPKTQEETPATEEAPADEEQPAAEEAPATEEAPAEEQSANEPAADAEGVVTEEPAAEQPADEEAPAEEQPSEEALQNAQADIDEIQETLHNAESMIEQKDKEIAENAKTIKNLTEQLDAAKAELETAKGGITEKNATIEANVKIIEENAKVIAEKQAEIDKLTKQVADLKAEVKELSEKETPMVDAGAGIPAGNGTGEAPKQKGSRIKRGMSYKQIREAMKEDK